MKHSNNWRDHLIILIIIQIAQRVISIYRSRPERGIIVRMALYLLEVCYVAISISVV
jgi:hypothetical protein